MRLALACLVLLPLLAGRAVAQETVPVAARDLARGTVLTAEDVAMAPAGGRRTLGLVEAPVGWVTRRVMAAGEVLREPAIDRPDVVTSGETVQLVWSDGALELRLRGRALASAAQGERVGVYVDGRRRFEGIAVGRALVRLDAREKSR